MDDLIIFTCCFVWVLDLTSHIKEITNINGVSEQGAEENIFKNEELTRRWRKFTRREAPHCALSSIMAVAIK